MIADYGHNPDAMRALVGAVRGDAGARRRTVVISGAGDRRDEDIREQTQILGAAFDEVLLYQDAAQRGRADGEVMALLRQGLRRRRSARGTSRRSAVSSSPSTGRWSAWRRATCAWCWSTRSTRRWRTWRGGWHNPAERAQRRFQNERCSAAISSSTSGTGPITSTAFWPRAKTSRQGRSSVGFSGWLPVSASSARSLMP